VPNRGEPVSLTQYPADAADDPEAVAAAAMRVKAAVQQLIDLGVAQRKGVFR